MPEDHEAPALRDTSGPRPLTLASGANEAPAVFDGREQRLDPRTIQVERLAGGIFAAVLAGSLLLAALAAGILAAAGPGILLLLLAAWLVASGLVTLFVLSWPAVSYRHTSYEVSDQGIRIRRGVLWRSVSSVPSSRVQHTDVSQGPIERMFGLATLIIYTAGTHHASVSLGGLARGTAVRIRDHLIEGSKDDAV